MNECIEEHGEQLGLIAPVQTNRLGCPGWKRSLDLLGVLLGLPIIFPLLLMVALAVWLLSRGPVFFKQQRVGYLGRLFTVWKFRTMHVDADPKAHQEHVGKLIAENLPLTKLDSKGDKRLIRGGALLRASCLDELPQLFNVLLGDMSLVGPRPCMEYEYERLLPWHKKRFNTPPGMTGLWQVKRQAQTSFAEMMHMDLDYVANRTLRLDLAILMATVPAVIVQLKNSRAAKRLRQQHQEPSK